MKRVLQLIDFLCDVSETCEVNIVTAGIWIGLAYGGLAASYEYWCHVLLSKNLFVTFCHLRCVTTADVQLSSIHRTMHTDPKAIISGILQDYIKIVIYIEGFIAVN